MNIKGGEVQQGRKFRKFRKKGLEKNNRETVEIERYFWGFLVLDPTPCTSGTLFLYIWKLVLILLFLPFVVLISDYRILSHLFRNMFGNCIFPLYFVFKNNFLFLKLKNLFSNPKLTKNKNCSQNSICEGNWKYAKNCFQFLIFKSQ